MDGGAGLAGGHAELLVDDAAGAAEGAVDGGQRQQDDAHQRRAERQGHQQRVALARGPLVAAAALVGLAKVGLVQRVGRVGLGVQASADHGRSSFNNVASKACLARLNGPRAKAVPGTVKLCIR